MQPHDQSFYMPMTVRSIPRPNCTTAGPVTETTYSSLFRYSKLQCGDTIHGDKITPNPFFMRKVVIDPPQGEMYDTAWTGWSVAERRFSSGPVMMQGLGINNIPLSYPIDGSMPAPSLAHENRATTKLFTALADSQQWNVEALETASLRHKNSLDRAISRLDKLSQDLPKPKANRSDTRGFLKFLGTTWLKKQYLWQPVINSIFESSLMVQQASMRPLYFKVSTRESTDESFVASYPTMLYHQAYQPMHVRRRKTMVIKYTIALKSNPLSIQDFITLDPANIAWQLLPYSFVVDWVFDVGSWLQNRETSTRFFRKFSHGCKTVSWREDVDMSISVSGNSGPLQCGNPYLCSARGSALNKGFSRTVLSGLPAIRPPVIDVSLGSERLFSLAALLGNRLGHPRYADYRKDFP